MADRELTYGEQQVGTGIDEEQTPRIAELRTSTAAFIDSLHNARENAGDAKTAHLDRAEQTVLEAMRQAMKAVTFDESQPDPEKSPDTSEQRGR